MVGNGCKGKVLVWFSYRILTGVAIQFIAGGLLVVPSSGGGRWGSCDRPIISVLTIMGVTDHNNRLISLPQRRTVEKLQHLHSSSLAGQRVEKDRNGKAGQTEGLLGCRRSCSIECHIVLPEPALVPSRAFIMLPTSCGYWMVTSSNTPFVPVVSRASCGLYFHRIERWSGCDLWFYSYFFSLSFRRIYMIALVIRRSSDWWWWNDLGT